MGFIESWNVLIDLQFPIDLEGGGGAYWYGKGRNNLRPGEGGATGSLRWGGGLRGSVWSLEEVGPYPGEIETRRSKRGCMTTDSERARPGRWLWDFNWSS